MHEQCWIKEFPLTSFIQNNEGMGIWNTWNMRLIPGCFLWSGMVFKEVHGHVSSGKGICSTALLEIHIHNTLRSLWNPVVKEPYLTLYNSVYESAFLQLQVPKPKGICWFRQWSSAGRSPWALATAESRGLNDVMGAHSSSCGFIFFCSVFLGWLFPCDGF